MAIMNTGNRVREAREKAGISRNDLAKRVGVSVVAVANWENQKNNLGGDNLISVARSLGVSPIWLQTGQGQPETASIVDIFAPSPETQQELALLELFRGLTEKQKSDVVRSLEAQEQQNKATWEELSKVMGKK